MSSNGPQAGSMSETPYQVAVLVPCYNEERAIAKVVADFRAALPDAKRFRLVIREKTAAKSVESDRIHSQLKLYKTRRNPTIVSL